MLVITLGLVYSGAASAQNQSVPASDLGGLPYNVTEMVSVIQEAYEAPEEINAYVLMLEDYEGFPSFVVGKKISKSKLKTLKTWVESNPTAIEALLIARKRNYDKYSNSATTKGSSK